jgi:hypothetical protein
MPLTYFALFEGKKGKEIEGVPMAMSRGVSDAVCQQKKKRLERTDLLVAIYTILISALIEDASRSGKEKGRRRSG